MSLSSQKILHRLYPEAPKLASVPSPGPGPRDKPLLEQLTSWLRSLGVVGITTIIGLTLWLFGIIHYYNMFVAMKSKAEGDWADTEVVMQERHHIVVNLTRLVIDYAQHERDVLTKVTGLRVGQTVADQDAAAAAAAAADIAKLDELTAAVAPNAEEKAVGAGQPPLPTADKLDKLSPKQVEALFGRMQLVAEQYPQLKLTENFQQFASAIIETEHKIAEHLIMYNADVNAYMTVHTQFPGNHYALILGFQRMEFFSADPSELQFVEVKY